MTKKSENVAMIKLYDFQEQSVKQLLSGKHIIVSDTGSGKSFMMFDYLRRKDPKKVLIVATPSKVKSKDFEQDADDLCGVAWRETRTVEIISWYKLYDWVYKEHWKDIGKDWVVAFDEIHMGAAGISSKRGKAMLALCANCKDWTGYTATPGDTWIKFYPYFTAAGKVRNKTDFKSKFCVEQRYPFPAILAYRQEDILKEWWAEISYAPDTADIFAQLPEKTYQIIKLDKPKGYDKCLKNSETLEGEFLDSNMAVAHYARQMCSTKAKKDWLSEFLDGLNGNAVIFYNYKKEREDICEVAKKAGYKVWRIDGEKHEIPTPDTIGKKDLVVAHYQSGSNSLNLQFMNYWVSYSYNYSYTTFLQALGRIDRIGQKKPMFFYFLKCKGTIEDDIAKALSNKQDFSEENWCIEKGIDNSVKVC